jgi:endonuclease/exonuclease/phosphatase family metal-dependent hydrolase
MRAILITVIIIALFAIGIRASFFFPAPITTVTPQCTENAGEVPTDGQFRVLVWNLQFAASRRHHFFYDGGEKVYVDPQEIEDNLTKIAQVIRKANADIVLLQEVDRDSARTGHIDQVGRINELLNYPCVTTTPYFKAPYVPHPSHKHLGGMDMHLATLSRYKTNPSTRYQLTLLNEPWYRRIFNLKRAALVTPMVTQDGRSLQVINTHLSAFSNADDTLPKQVAELQNIVAHLQSHPTILAGDFNALPPGFDRNQTAEPDFYHEKQSPIQPLFDSLVTPTPPSDLGADREKYGTYRPFRAQIPDRTIDYVFGANVTFHDHTVIRTEGLSDHEPVLVTVSLK